MKCVLKCSFKYLPLFILLLFGTTVIGQRPFITEWVTKRTNNLTIPTNPDYDCDYEVVCKRIRDDMEVFSQSGLKGNVEITGLDDTTAYRVYITGNFPGIYFDSVYNEYNNAILKSIVQWGDIEWRSFERAFTGCEEMDIIASDIPDLSGVNSMHRAFAGCVRLEGENSNWNWDVSNITDMSFMFANAQSFNQDIGKWDVSNVTKMSYMFFHTYYFNKNLGSWDVSKVKYMDRMFNHSSFFNQNIGHWDVSSVEDMSGMFNQARSFKQDLSSWNTSNVLNMSEMFLQAGWFNSDIGNWDVSSVTDMGRMFLGSYSFNQNIGNWDVSAVTNMESMFGAAPNFNQNISNWNVSTVTNMYGMFAETRDFNQDIGNWDVSNVTDMVRMFHAATAFNQNIGNWTLNDSVELIHFFEYTNMDCINYSLTIKGWAENPKTPNNRSLDARDTKYSEEVKMARQKLLDKGWTILGDTEANCTVSTENHNELVFEIIPNPAFSDVTLIGLIHDSKVEIADITGKIMNRYIAQDDYISISIDDYPVGLYFVRVSTPQGINGIRKLVKL